MQSLTKAPAQGQEKTTIDFYVPGLVLDKREEKYHLYAEQAEHGQKYIVECFIKGDGYVLHKIFACTKLPPEQQILRETLKRGCKSKRPYLAGQRSDGTIAATVFHLYVQLCGQSGIDPLHLYNSNYPENPISDMWLLECLDHAEWQGVELITEWDETNVHRVLQSLTEINLNGLRASLEEFLEVSK